MRQETADDIGKLLLRLTLGMLILLHGTRKLIDGVGSVAGMLESAGLPSFFAYGAYLGEVVGPVLLLIGWFARIGAALIAINMLFALALVSGGDLLALNEFGGWAFELEGMYLLTAIALLFAGPGRLGLNGR